MEDNAVHSIAVRGTELLSSDPRQRYREKIARIALDSMAQFVGLLDAQGYVLEINKVVLDEVGISLADVEGKPFWTGFWWQVSEKINSDLRESIARAAQGEFVRWDTPIYGRAGGKETIVIEASLRPILDDEGKVAFICFEGRDVTEKKVAENASRAKDEFLAMLGHELRNPLSPIVTALQLLKLEGPGDSELARMVIERQVTHLIRLVDDLLDVARIAQGKVELKKEVLELSEIVAKGVEVATPLLEQHRHTLRVDVPAFGLQVNADPTRLGQVVANLLTNAAKYTPPSGHIEVRAQIFGDELSLSIRDNGIGIAPEVLPYVFDLFVQEGQALNRAQGGLGLGLAIARQLVELHGGSVSARSAGLGQGSEFTIRLPRITWVKEEAPWVQTAAVADAESAGTRVLLVDDNEDAARVLSLALTHRGYEIHVFHDAASALRGAAELVPDIALVDIGLPVMDGYELGACLRQTPGLHNLRLVALTGYGQDSDRERSKEAGFDLHLLKPIEIAVLDSAIQTLTNG